MFCLQAGLLAWSGLRHSPTYDEVAHLPAGITHWHGDLSLFRVNPPLTRMIAAIPAVVLGADVDWGLLQDSVASGSFNRIDFEIGRRFVSANGSWSFWLYTFGRWMCIPLVLSGGWVVWRWATDWYGRGSGLLALAIWTFSPMVIGHGALLTPDVSAASLGTLAGYRLWRWSESFAWPDAFWSGVTIGLALLTKTTWLTPLPPMLALVAIDAAVRRRRWTQIAGQVVMVALVAWNVLLIGYQGDGVFEPLGSYRFESTTLAGPELGGGLRGNRFDGTIWEHLPVPLPRQMVAGIDVQRHNFEQDTYAYLNGELRRGGWWYYYLAAVCLKTPLGWLLVLVAVTTWRLGTIHRTAKLREWFLLTPPLLVLLLVSSQTGINKHLRYLLPAYPFAIVWISQAVVIAAGVVRGGESITKRRLATQWALAVCLVWGMMSSLVIYPHSMSYFNELAGGPRGGHRYLINSNVDWGQDLFYLRRKMRDLRWDDVTMVYWGRYDATLAGLTYDVPPRNPGAEELVGRYAIGVSYLHGYPMEFPDGDGGLRYATVDEFKSLESFVPVDSAGYSMMLYDIAGGSGGTDGS